MTGGRVLADLACTIADGARVISDFRVMSDQRELFGLVASVPTAWRTLAEIARPGTRADRQVNAAWMTAAMTGQILLAWLKLLALDGDLVKAEPKTLRPGCCTPPPAWCAADGGAA